MTFEGLRGYAPAANDLSSIARARLLESVREAVRAEVEKAGAAVGLASAEEVAVLRRTVDRLQRRVVVLEAAAAGAPAPAVTTPSAPTGEGAAARPARRPSAARARATGRAPVGDRPPAGASPHRSRPAAPASPPTDDAPTQTATAAAGDRPQPPTPRRRRSTSTTATSPTGDEGTSASTEETAAPSAGVAEHGVTPVRRPRRTTAKPAAKPAAEEPAAGDDGQNAGGRP